jgi:hypothetical protein
MSKSKNQRYFLEAREPKFKKVSIKKKFENRNYLKSIKQYKDAIVEEEEEEDPYKTSS